VTVPSGGDGAERLLNIGLLDSHLHVTRTITKDNQSIEPAISPDGRQVAFATGRGHPIDYELGPLQTAIHIMNIDGTDDHEVIAQGRLPAWSPDGSQLAFIGDGLEVVDLKTGDQSMITAVPAGGLRLQWLADDQIAVIDDKGISTVPSSGGRLTRRFRSDTSVAIDSTATWVAQTQAMQGGPIRVLDRRTGTSSTVPRSATETALPLGWTTAGELVFTQNVRGPDVNITTWSPGPSSPRVLGQLVTLPPDLALNPRCSP
jgi:hypothetical protein